MRIEKITICNLTSIEGEQVVDFTVEPLKSAGLFAITGGTGAGKSTLLDAICLALYNHAPRYEGTERIKSTGLEEETTGELTPGNVRNILRRGCTEGYCSVVFSLTDGTIYEAGWYVRIKKTGTYDSVKRSLRRLQPSKQEYDTREIDSRIVELTHLNYEQFTRTVILAQNNFANFLNAKRTDKATLLEKLTGTELFGNISKKIYEEYTKAQAEYDKLLEKINGISTRQLDEDKLERLKEDLNIERSLLTRDEEVVEGIRRKLNWYERYNKAQSDYKEQQAQLDIARRNYNALYDKGQLLKRYDQLQVFQPLYHLIKDTERDINDLKAQINTKQGTLHKIKANLDQAKKNYVTAKNRLDESNEAYRIKEPQFNIGHNLQGQIKATEAEIKAINEELEHYRDELHKEQEHFSEQENLRDEITAKKNKDIQQIQTIAMHRALIERIEYVKAQISKMNELFSSSEELSKEIDDIHVKLKNEKSAEENLKQEQTDLEASIKSLKEELFIHTQANQGLSSSNVQTRLNRLQDTHRKAKSALDLWQRIQNDYHELEDKSDEIRRREISIEQVKKEIEKQNLKVHAQSETLEVLRTSFMLSQSENIIELRRKLIEGTVCPVCGATHHPYHSETEQELGRILNSLEKDFKEAEEKTELEKKQLLEMQKQQSKESGELSQAYIDKTRIQKVLESDISKWKDFESMDASLVGCSANINRDNRTILIRQLYENSERELHEAQNTLDSFNNHQEAINNINEKIRNKSEERSEKMQKYSTIESNMRILDERLKISQRTLTSNAVTFEGIQNTLDSIITIPSWKDLWKKGHDTFLQYLTNLAETWNKTTQSIQESEKKEFQLQEDINAIIGRIEEKEQRMETIQSNISSKNLTIERLRLELRKMFGDSGLEETMQNMRDVISSNNEEENKCHTEYEKIRQNVQNLEGELQGLEEQQQRREDDLRNSRSDLDINISRFNSDNSTLQYFELEKILTDNRDWNALRDKIDKAQEALHRAEYHGENVQRVIAELRQDTNMPSEKNEESEPALKAKLVQLLNSLEELRKSVKSNDVLLEMHMQSLEDINKILPEKETLQKRLDNWEKLNTIIGSADGKRFREIAQCYTFSILVKYANRHLVDLTQRYRLRNKPGTLSLEIVDREMLDQVRTINSLSGGETFIVSLALALGLSSMASNETTIGSLFIDEGFGNLDSASLDMVIDTLANLQEAQGRKVGIISHTAQIRSRISPQVRLVKHAMGGKSHIEVR